MPPELTESTDLKYENKSIVAGYIPVDIDKLFDALCQVTSILDEISVPYAITGGTLLGAVREGDLIRNDTDFDIDILDSEVETILEHADLFNSKGFQIRFPLMQDVAPFNHDGPPIENCERRIVKIFDDEGNFYGDLFIYHLFSDGMLRRISIDKQAYFNAKMTYPYWFFENREKIKIRDKSFSCPKYPRSQVERIYGPMWQTPISRHAKIRGYNFAGAAADADVETSVDLAISEGWIPYYPEAPRWPMPIKYTSTPVSLKWIMSHEHPYLIESSLQKSSNLTIDELNSQTILLYRNEISRLTAKLNDLRTVKGNRVTRPLRRFIRRLAGLPTK